MSDDPPTRRERALRGALRRCRVASMAAASPDAPTTTSRAGIRATYRVWSTFYDASCRLDPAYRRNARAMVSRTVRPGDQTLDVGTGTGLLLEWAAPLAQSVVALDFSPAMLARAASFAARRRLANVSLRWGDVLDLPFEDATFDSLVSSFMMAHIPRERRSEALGEMSRVLVPGGRLGLYLARGELFPIWPRRDDLERLCADAGLGGADIDDCDDVYRVAVASKAS